MSSLCGDHEVELKTKQDLPVVGVWLEFYRVTKLHQGITCSPASYDHDILPFKTGYALRFFFFGVTCDALIRLRILITLMHPAISSGPLVQFDNSVEFQSDFNLQVSLLNFLIMTEIIKTRVYGSSVEEWKLP